MLPSRSSTAAVFRAQNIPSLEQPTSGQWSGGTISPSDMAVLAGSTRPCHHRRDTMVGIPFSALSYPLPIPFTDTDLKPQTVLPDIDSETAQQKILCMRLYLLCPLTTQGSMVSIKTGLAHLPLATQ